MIKIRDKDDAARSQKRAAAQRRKCERKSLEVSRAQAAEEQQRLCEERVRIRLAAEAQMREQASLDAARAFDVQDFVDKVGRRTEASKNRWVAVQRVLLLSKALPHQSMKKRWRGIGRSGTVRTATISVTTHPQSPMPSSKRTG